MFTYLHVYMSSYLPLSLRVGLYIRIIIAYIYTNHYLYIYTGGKCVDGQNATFGKIRENSAEGKGGADRGKKTDIVICEDVIYDRQICAPRDPRHLLRSRCPPPPWTEESARNRPDPALTPAQHACIYLYVSVYALHICIGTKAAYAVVICRWPVESPAGRK